MPTQDPVGDVLVVDDTPANLLILTNMLKSRGYRVRPVNNGPTAIRAAKSNPPDIVLLDINMPGMSGYEVCEQFAEDETLRSIPIIFISALSAPLDKERAFAAGGVDYVTKPFQLEEVRARVATHLRLRRLQQGLERQNAELKALEVMRENLVHMLVHDMRSPLTGLVTSLQFVAREAMTSLSEDNQEDIKLAVESGKRLNGMINELLDISRMEAGEIPLEREPCRISDVVDDARAALGGLLRDRALETELDGQLTIEADRKLLGRIVTNLLANALRYSPATAPVQLRARMADGKLRIEVSDRGPGIPAEYQTKIFEKFGQAEARATRSAPASGLGLAFCRLAVQAHGGRIDVDSVVGEGSTFWLELPATHRPN